MDKLVFNSKLTDVDSSAKDPVGSIRVKDGVFYKYVRLVNDTATVAGVAGDPVAYAVSVAGATYAGYDNGVVCLDMTDAAAQPILAGFLLATITGTADTSYYCWIQLSGVVTVPTAVTSGVVGTGNMMSTTDKTLTVATGVINPGCVQLTATAANNKVIARCPF